MNINKSLIFLLSIVLSGCYSVSGNLREGGTFIPHAFADRPNPKSSNQSVDYDNPYRYVGPYQDGEVYSVNPRWVSSLKFNGHLLVKDNKVIRVFKDGEYHAEITRIYHENNQKAQNLILDNNLKMIYNSGEFYILEDSRQVRFYLNKGEFKNFNDVASEIQEYEQSKKKEERWKIEQNKRERIKRLEDEFVRRGGSLEFETNRLCASPSQVCGRGADWEDRLEKFISQAKRAELARNLCLNSGLIGICITDNQYKNRMQIEVKNNTGKVVSDIKFECVQIAKSGTHLLKNAHTIFDTWQIKEVKLVNIKFLQHEQFSTFECKAFGWR